MQLTRVKCTMQQCNYTCLVFLFRHANNEAPAKDEREEGSSFSPFATEPQRNDDGERNPTRKHTHTHTHNNRMYVLKIKRKNWLNFTAEIFAREIVGRFRRSNIRENVNKLRSVKWVRAKSQKRNVETRGPKERNEKRREGREQMKRPRARINFFLISRHHESLRESVDFPGRKFTNLIHQSFQNFNCECPATCSSYQNLGNKRFVVAEASECFEENRQIKVSRVFHFCSVGDSFDDQKYKANILREVSVHVAPTHINVHFELMLTCSNRCNVFRLHIY